MSKKFRWILLGVAVFFLLMAACYTVFIAPLLKKDTWVYKDTTVERGTLTVGVSESGSLDYGISSIMYALDLDVSNSDDEDDDGEDEETVQKYLRIEEIYAVPGQRIKEGDSLIKFTEDSVSDVRKLLQSALVEAKSEYNDAESEYNLSALEAQTTYDTSKVLSDYATSIYNNANKAINNEITSLQVQIDICQANTASLEEKVTEANEKYQDTLDEYNRVKETMNLAGMDNLANYMSVQSAYISAQTQYQNAKSSLSTAKQNLENNTAEINSLRNELAVAKAKKQIEKLGVEKTYQESVISGDNAQITYNAQLESLKETLDEADEKKKKIEEQLSAFEEFVGTDGILYADGQGIVTELAYQEGDTLEQQGIIISYAKPENMTISVDVTQEDVVDLSVGDAVSILFSAYTDTDYEGTILSIDTTATSESSNTVSYTVVIGVNGDTEALYGGMTADITFITEEKEDVLYVSKKAIVEENGRTYVYKATELGGKELTEVETGVSNGVNIEILSGLSESDTIYIASKVSSEEDVEESSFSEDSTSQDSNSQMQFPEGFDMNGGNMPEGIPDRMPSGMLGGQGQ